LVEERDECQLLNNEYPNPHRLEGTGRVTIPPSSWKSNNSRCLGMVVVDTVILKLRSKVGNVQVLQLACTEQGSIWEEYSGFPGTFLLMG